MTYSAILAVCVEEPIGENCRPEGDLLRAFVVALEWGRHCGSLIIRRFRADDRLHRADLNQVASRRAPCGFPLQGYWTQGSAWDLPR